MPPQILDMNLTMFRAVVEGYQEHLFDEECLAVKRGFWTGYYSGMSKKKPKPVKDVLQQMIREHNKQKRQTKYIDKPKPDVDVEKFLQQERRFHERFNSKG